MKRQWLAIGVVSLGLGGLSSVRVAHATDSPGRSVITVAADERGQAVRKQVRFDDLPRRVRETLEREAPNVRFEQITQVTRGGQTWYVAEQRNGRVIRIDSNGRLIEAERQQGDRLDEERRNTNRKVVAFDRLPEAVQQTVNNVRGGDKVTRAVQITRGNETFYRVRLEGDERARMVQLDHRGTILSQWNATEQGRVDIRYRDLPEPVRSTLQDVTRGDNIEEITQVTRNNQTWYVVDLADRNGNLRTVRIDNRGSVIPE